MILEVFVPGLAALAEHHVTFESRASMAGVSCVHQPSFSTSDTYSLLLIHGLAFPG